MRVRRLGVESDTCNEEYIDMIYRQGRKDEKIRKEKDEAKSEVREEIG